MHHVLEFNQWLKQYVEFNTHQKKKKNRGRKKWRQRLEGFAQINEQYCIQKNNKKLKK